MGVKLTQRNKAIMALVMCALLWSTSGFVLKSIVVLDSMRVSGYRCLVSALFMICIQGKPIIEKKNHWFIVGCITYAVASYLIVLANSMTTAANAIILQYIAPVFVCMFSVILLHQKMEKNYLIVIGAVLFGLGFFFKDSLSMDMKHSVGNIVALVAGAGMALQAVSVCQMQDIRSVRSIIIIGSILNFCICLLFMKHGQAPITEYFWVLFLGVFQLGVSYMLYSWAVNFLTPLEVILIPAIEPLVNPLLTLLFRGERISVDTIVGGVIVVGSITAWSIWKEKKNKQSV